MLSRSEPGPPPGDRDPTARPTQRRPGTGVPRTGASFPAPGSPRPAAPRRQECTMLAPGDFLTTPPEPRGEPGARRAEAVTTPGPQPAPPAAGAVVPEKPERESF